jgi:hypothetical protein
VGYLRGICARNAGICEVDVREAVDTLGLLGLHVIRQLDSSIRKPVAT